jgi:hypothetical protein
MVSAVAGRFCTGPLSRQTTTNIDVIAHLMDVAIDLVEEPTRVCTVSLTRKLPDAVACPQELLPSSIQQISVWRGFRRFRSRHTKSVRLGLQQNETVEKNATLIVLNRSTYPNESP